MHENFLQFRERPLVDGGAGDQQEITLRGEAVLVGTKKFTEAALGTIAVDGVAHGSGRCDHAGTRS
jgi:hypothetical protein